MSVYRVGTNKESNQGTLYKTNNFWTNKYSKTRILNRHTFKFHLHWQTVEGIPCLFIELAQTKKQRNAHFTEQTIFGQTYQSRREFQTGTQLSFIYIGKQ